MKLYEIPLNTMVELHFNYMGYDHKVNAGLLYKNDKTVYVSAIKNAGKTIPASKLKNAALIYKTAAGVYTFKELTPRSISYNGQNLYVVQSEQEVQIVNHRNTYRLSVGTNVAAKIMISNVSVNYINCILKDISMNGMGIISNKEIDSIAKIEISFRVNKNKVETLIGKIVHAYEFTNGLGYFYGCVFEEPNNTIGKYIATKYPATNILTS